MINLAKIAGAGVNPLNNLLIKYKKCEKSKIIRIKCIGEYNKLQLKKFEYKAF